MSESLVDELVLEVNIGTIGKDSGMEYVEGLYSHLYYTVLAKCGYCHGDNCRF